MDTYTQAEIDEALLAVIAFAGNASAAKRHLDAHDKRAPRDSTLRDWMRSTHWQRYQDLREKWSEQMETGLANDMRDAARAAVDAQMVAIEKAKERLEKDLDEDPGRTAANLARAAQSSTDKMLTLQGKPTSITENRDPMEIMRSLIAMGVLKAPDEPAQISSSTVGANE